MEKKSFGVMGAYLSFYLFVVLCFWSNGIITFDEKLNLIFFIIIAILSFIPIIRINRDSERITNLKIFKDIICKSNNFNDLNKEIKEKLDKNSEVYQEWNSYLETLYEKEGQRYETISSEMFFNFDNLYRDKIRYKLYNHFPQVILGLGMLGTFLGLSLGLSKLDLSTADSIQKGVGNLLGGVKTAFYTSLFGLSFSIIFSLFNNAYFSEIEKIISVIKCEVSKKMKRFAKQNSIDDIIKSLDSIRSSNDDMAKNLSNQISAMSNTINENMVQTLISMKNSNQYMTENLSSQISVMSTALNESICNFSKSIGGNFQEELSQSLDKIFNKDFIYNLNISMEKVSETFLENSEKMSKFKDEIVSVTDSLLEIKNSYSPIINNVYSLKEEVGNMMNTATESLKNLTTSLDEVSQKHTKAKIEMEELFISIKDVQEENKEILEVNKEALERTNETIINAKGMIEMQENIHALWESYDRNFKEINNNLSLNLETYKDNLEKTVIKLKDILRENIDSYNTCIKSQTVDYTNEIKNGMMSLFNDYDHNLSKVVGSFNTVLLNFNENINTFSELVSETKETIETHMEALEKEKNREEVK